jgi:GNAT superfamily N-acetyltransferase
MLLALDEERVVGAAHLKFREMEIYPEREHWLGGVYVEKAYRGRGIASELTADLVSIAGHLGVKVLHLQTERLDGGLYAHLGWSGHERVSNHGVEVLVMSREIA